MRTTKFLFVVFLFTIFALFYVRQSIHEIELSYKILEREKIINNLIDQNRILKYKVAQLKSPLYLERRLLAKHTGLKYTKPRVMITELEKENLPFLKFTKKYFFWKRINEIISKILVIRSEVEAKP